MKFFLTATITNDKQYLVHTSVCDFLPVSSLRIDLGEHYCCESALKEAKKEFSNSTGCFHCSLLCHDASFSKNLEEITNH